MDVLMDEVLMRIKTPLSDILQSIPAVQDDSNSIVRVEESCFEMLTVINDAIDFLNLLTEVSKIIVASDLLQVYCKFWYLQQFWCDMKN